MDGLELASKVSTKESYFFGDKSSKYKVAALDLGIKKNILMEKKMEERLDYDQDF